MHKCDSCGNEYDKAFQVIKDEKTMWFDSIECVAHMIAPKCGQCDMKILGHGVEVKESIFCCANCAREAGHVGVVDNTAA